MKGSCFCSMARAVEASCHSLVIVLGAGEPKKHGHVNKSPSWNGRAVAATRSRPSAGNGTHQRVGRCRKVPQRRRLRR